MNAKLLSLLLAAMLVIANAQSQFEPSEAGEAAAEAAAEAAEAAAEAAEDAAEAAAEAAEDAAEAAAEAAENAREAAEDAAEAAAEAAEDAAEAGLTLAPPTAAPPTAAPPTGAPNPAQIAARGNQGGAQPAAINAAGAPLEGHLRSESSVQAAGKSIGMVIGAVSAVVVVTMVAVFAIRKNRASQGLGV